MIRLDDEALDALRLAAEEIAFLTGRGYARDEAKQFVATHRALASEQVALLERAVCSEAQYRARAVKEMLPEDIARRPLLVDGHDVLDAVTTALAGGALLEGLDQTVQPVTPGGSPDHLDAALERIGVALREMRPSKTRWLLATGYDGVAALGERIVIAAKKWKVPVEVASVDDPKAVLRSSGNVATSDPDVIDACRTWCNLAGPVVAAIPAARRIKLQ